MPPKLVVIEDEPDTLAMLKAFLELFGFEVVGALTGEAGQKAIEEHCPDVLILDLMLPDIDGYEICRSLRAGPVTRGLPIIILSARTSQSEVERGYALGATRYLKKPVDLDRLVAEVQSAIGVGGHRPPALKEQIEDASDSATGEAHLAQNCSEGGLPSEQ